MSKKSTSGGDREDENWRSSLNGGDRRSKKKQGILRLDISKPRRSSGGSVEFRAQPVMLGEESTSPSGPASPHQLSVTWASQCDLNDPNSKAKQMLGHLEPTTEKGKRLQEDKPNDCSTNLTSHPLDACGMQQQPATNGDDDDEEYSISVSAIMQRRASVRGNRKRGRRNSRRGSSPMDHVLDTVSQMEDRRRSSVYTTSSGDTAISVDDGTNQDSTQEQIYENIRLHKEVIQSVKLQPWNIRKKLKLVRQAKTYVARHEGALQERFALSRSLRDLWARFKILMAARWRHWKREMSSFLTVLIPWELRIKEIESHFGSGVASYFTFLRWLLWVNIMMTIPLVAFVIAPEVLSTDPNEVDPRKKIPERELKVAGNIFTIWEFEGYLKYSPLFYGYYSSKSGASQRGYNLPLAYFLTAVVVYIYSFVATLRKMAENSRNSKLSSKDDECIFSWKLFTGWDFMIGHAETAHNRIASVVVGFKEALLEEAEKKKDKRNWRIILQRILVNILVIGLLAASGYTVVSAVDRSENIGNNASWFRRNEVNVIMTLLSFFLPMFFDALGLFENWHPRQQLRLQLARIMILNLLNLYSLMFSFIYKITGKDENLQLLKEIEQNATIERGQIEKLIASLIFASSVTTQTADQSSFSDLMPSSTSSYDLSSTPSTTSALLSTTTLTNLFNKTRCFTVRVNCSIPRPLPARTLTTSMLLLNLSTTMLPNLWTSPLTTPSTLSTTPYSEPSTTIDFLTSTIGFNDSTSSPGSTTIDPSTEDDWSSTTSMQYSTFPPPSSTVSEDYHLEYNNTFFEYADYFDNFEYDTDAAGSRVKRSNDEFLNSTENTSTSSVSTDYTDITDTSSWQYSTEISASSTDNTDQPTTIDFSSMTTVDEFIESLSTSVSSTATESERDKVLEYITTPTSVEPDVLDPSTSTVTTTTTAASLPTIFISGNQDFVEEQNCTQTICITLPPDFFPTPETKASTSTEPSTSLSTVTTMTPLLQIEYEKERLKNITLILENVRRNLTSMCWETSLGQELSKVIVFDMIMSILAPLCIDFLRALFVRYMNKYWCWDMEKTFPQYGDFKIAESILNLVYNQGQVWMGIFFSPGLVIINFVKLMILMYLRSWIVLTCNVPHEVVFKASKSNNFYLSLLLTMLFLCVLPVGYAIVWLRPSWHCGPFSDYDRISEFFTTTIINALPPELHRPLEYMTSSSTVIPLLLLLTLIIYYLVSLTGALREANQDLRNQLQKEREEERKKMFKLPETKSNEQATTALTNRWRKVLEASSPMTPTGPGQQPPDFDEASKNQARKELIARIMKKALRKGSATSDDDSFVRSRDEDDTDTEHHESLPHDEESKEKLFGLSKLQNIRKTRKPSLIDIVQIAKNEQNKAKEGHPKSRFKVDKAVKSTKPENATKSVDNDNDPETNSRVVSERRMSLLRKQSQQVEPTCSKPLDNPEAASNFVVINEKATDTLRKHKRKTNQSSAEPDVFKFDDAVIKSVERSKAKTAQSLDEAEAIEKKHPTEASHEEEHPQPHKNEKFINLSKQGRRKFGSFMTLVREAVKKVEMNAANGETLPPKLPSPPPPNESEPKVENKPEPQPESKTSPVASARLNLESVQKEPIDSEEEDQPGPIPPPVRSGSLRWVERPTPMRQDSQTSVWSDNIPTITISTTGSEECILDCTAEKAGTSPKPQGDDANSDAA